ncbi:MAG TPA: CARDB domain-containing protein, partial [Isosphaeraceae bacterium]|nr:CARDB domain-containing protein [Isosphaeraceae bacterium]
MSSHDRRAAARRRAWGRGPIILRFEPLEGRQLLAATPTPLPDLVGAAFDTLHNLDWGDSFHAVGRVANQGRGPATAPFHVEILASSQPALGPGSVPLGEATIPAGLAPDQSAPFDAVVALPATPIPGYTDGQPIYIATLIDPEGGVAESNKSNNFGIGQGNDTSVVTITPHLPANLVGSSLGVSPDRTSWGQPIMVTAQVKNNAQGDAPATRARVVLTPSGTPPGTGSDVTIGYLNIPAIPAWQTINVQQSITLPAGPPSSLADSTGFILSLAQDSDFQTDPLWPHRASQGLGLDMVLLTIGPGPNANIPQGPEPDLAADAVVAPSQPIFWGQSFQVRTGVDNLGRADAGPFHVQFLLTGANGSLDHAIYLGDAAIPGLAKDMHQDVIRTLKLPGRLPNGLALDSVGVGRIAAVVDPDNTVDESLRTNNAAVSNPVTLRVLGSDGTSTVPTLPPATTTPTLGKPTPAGTVRTEATPPHAAKAQPLKHYRHIKPHTSLASKVEHRLKIFPRQVNNFV